MAALSTNLILRSLPSAQRMISKAQPQAAMPPPIIRISTSSSMISGFPKAYASAIFDLTQLVHFASKVGFSHG